MPAFQFARRLAIAVPVAALSAVAIAAPGAAQASQPAQESMAKAGVAAAKHEPVATAARRRCRSGYHAVRTSSGRRVCRRNTKVVYVNTPAPAPAPAPTPAPAPAPAPTMVDIARSFTENWARGTLSRNAAYMDFFIIGCQPVNSYSAYCDMGIVVAPGNVYEQYRVNVFTGANGTNGTYIYSGTFYR
jgi:hypothetical protein